jgi:chloramphenicol O-acetyltransferase type A
MKEIDPQETSRAQAFELWKDAPMPMVTLFKTLDITRLVKMSKRTDYKFNMLMCWCIVKAASRQQEFYLLSGKDKLLQYEKLAINVVVKTKNGGICNSDIPYSEDIEDFNKDYIRIVNTTYETCQMYSAGEDFNIIGTSSLSRFDIDGVTNMFSGRYTNPFLIWGKYRKKWFKKTLRVSLQFHHVQMDGEQACIFLDDLQETIYGLNW